MWRPTGARGCKRYRSVSVDKSKAAAAGAGAAIIALATAMIAPWEGKVNAPYRDPVGILTVCYGHTGADIEQRRYSDAECLQMLEADVKKHAAVLKCAGDGYKLREGAAFVSLGFNIGVAGYCKSTSAKRAQAGDYAGACEAMSRHVKAKGKVLQGLVERRAYERALCEGDFDTARAIAKRNGLKALMAAADAVEAADIDEATAAEAEAARAAAIDAAKKPSSAPSAPAAMPTPSAPEKHASAPIFGFLGGCTCSRC